MMKRLILLSTLALSTFAQVANPDALFLSDAQVKRLNDTQARIELLKAQLETAQKVQENEILKIQLECGATPDKYEPLALVEGKLAFKRKVEAKAAEPAATPSGNTVPTRGPKP